MNADRLADLRRQSTEHYRRHASDEWSHNRKAGANAAARAIKNRAWRRFWSRWTRERLATWL